MHKFGYTNWAKIAGFLISLAWVTFMAWGAYDQWGKNTILVAGCIAMGSMLVPPLINVFVRKIVLGDEYVEDRHFYNSKRIDYSEITHIGLANGVLEFSDGHKNIKVPKLIVKNFTDLTTTLFSRIPNPERILVSGDLITLQEYMDSIAPSAPLKELMLPSRAGKVLVSGTRLTNKAWLYREVELITTDGPFTLSYFGRGDGYECIIVNDALVAKEGRTFWYVPQFDFQLRDSKVTVNVRVSPWLSLRKFSIVVDGKTVYQEN